MSAEILLLPIVGPMVLAHWTGMAMAEILKRVQETRDENLRQAQLEMVRRMERLIQEEVKRKETMCASLRERCRQLKEELASLSETAGGEQAGQLEALRKELDSLMDGVNELSGQDGGGVLKDIQTINRTLQQRKEKVEKAAELLVEARASLESSLTGSIASCDFGAISETLAAEEPAGTPEFDRVWETLNRLMTEELPAGLSARVR